MLNEYSFILVGNSLPVKEKTTAYQNPWRLGIDGMLNGGTFGPDACLRFAAEDATVWRNPPISLNCILDN